MNDLNNISLEGRLTKDVAFGGKTKNAFLSVANNMVFSKTDKEKADPNDDGYPTKSVPSFFDCKLNKGLSDSINTDKVKKGVKVLLTGRLITTKKPYFYKDGNNFKETHVDAPLFLVDTYKLY